VKALIFGASGGLATALADSLLARNWKVDLVTRGAKAPAVKQRFASSIAEGRTQVFDISGKYSDFTPTRSYRAYFFPQALFSRAPLAATDDATIEREIEVGLADLIRLTRKLLTLQPTQADTRCDYCFVGSTSAYAGFAHTSVYCAVKHGLLGFVRALNDEYARTDTRFWMFSMGTMNTEMGRKLTEQDPSSFLQPVDVAERIANTICSGSNLFEPEVVIRRRTIRFLEK